MSLVKEQFRYQDLENYTVMNIIGTGSFGTCYKVREKTQNKYYVWKAVDYGSMTVHEKELLVTEVNLMGTLKHPHIVQYFGRIIHKSSGTLYIIMEWCEGGDLHTLVRNCRSKKLIMNERFIWKVLYQTSKALEACHSLLKQVTVLHRDIKPANIFLDKDYNVKLGDFGLAKILQKNVHFSSTVVGTPYYMSPEQLHGSKYNKKSDVWSLGCLIYELCCLNQPFNGKDILDLRTNISRNRLSRIPSMYSDYLDKIVRLLLSSNHESRPSVEIIVHHPTVICNYDANALPFHPEKSHKGNGDLMISQARTRYHVHDSTFQVIDDNIDNIIRKIETTRVRCSSSELEPQTITENVYNQKLVDRLKLLREKEYILKAKEDSLKAKEHLLQTRESTLQKKQKQIEKRECEIVALHRNGVLNENSSVQCKSNLDKREYRKSKFNVDLDSTTYSADPGDTSIMPTTVKLDPSKIIRPAYFVRNNTATNCKKNCFISEGTEVKEKKNCLTRQPFLHLQNMSSQNRSKSTKLIKNYQNYLYKR